MKKVVSITLTLAILFAVCVSASAATSTPILPLWDNTKSIDSTLTLNGTNSIAESEIIGNTDTAKIDATHTVYRLMGDDWLYINQTEQTVYSNYLNIAVRFTALGGSTYKSILVVNVTNSAGVTESIQRARYALS